MEMLTTRESMDESKMCSRPKVLASVTASRSV
jgi:hypothetical protein